MKGENTQIMFHVNLSDHSIILQIKNSFAENSQEFRKFAADVLWSMRRRDAGVDACYQYFSCQNYPLHILQECYQPGRTVSSIIVMKIKQVNRHCFLFQCSSKIFFNKIYSAGNIIIIQEHYLFALTAKTLSASK